MKDWYTTLQESCFGQYKEKGSKFFSYGFNIDNEKTFENKLNVIKKEHKKARHFCYAYRLGIDKDRFRTNDDGEPSGTAGYPILGVIDSSKMSNVAIVVVRYFGGTKLGTTGLKAAFKSAAKDCLVDSEVTKVYLSQEYILSIDYAHLGRTFDILNELRINIEDKQYNLDPQLTISLRLSTQRSDIRAIKAALLGRSPKDITEDTKIDYLTITQKTG